MMVFSSKFLEKTFYFYCDEYFMKKILCIISGPTASGKTSTSIQLAKSFGGEIINFDSLLFYHEITIGTAKPTIEEREGIPHHLIDIKSVKDPINAADYAKLAIELINKLHAQDKIVYLVGGSGFYLQAVLKGMYESQTTPDEITEKSNALYLSEGIIPFRQLLKEVDLDSYNQYHENDHYRNRRAVEHYWANKTKFSQEREKMKEKEPVSPVSIFGWNTFHVHLDLDKEVHFDIIKKRTSQMLKAGLIEEIQSLKDQGFTGEEKPLKSIGYRESFDYLKGSLETLPELEERINISTRQLAKSQRTWFKKVEKMTFNPLFDIKDIEEKFASYIELSKESKDK
jgi:tRNA dimethylallyltransferase